MKSTQGKAWRTTKIDERIQGLRERSRDTESWDYKLWAASMIDALRTKKQKIQAEGSAS